MLRRHHLNSQATLDKLTPLSQLWILRLLVLLGGHREFIRKDGFSNDALAGILGLCNPDDFDEENFDPQAARTELRKLHQRAELKPASSTTRSCLGKNIASLSQLISLSETDRRLLEFAVLVQMEPLLMEVLDWLGNLSSLKLFHVLSVVLSLPVREIRSSLGPQGPLIKSGLIKRERDSLASAHDRLQLLSDNFVYKDSCRDAVGLSEMVHLGQ